jgi:hypothetical protein
MPANLQKNSSEDHIVCISLPSYLVFFTQRVEMFGQYLARGRVWRVEHFQKRQTKYLVFFSYSCPMIK